MGCFSLKEQNLVYFGYFLSGVEMVRSRTRDKVVVRSVPGWVTIR